MPISRANARVGRTATTAVVVVAAGRAQAWAGDRSRRGRTRAGRVGMIAAGRVGRVREAIVPGVTVRQWVVVAMIVDRASRIAGQRLSR